MTDDLQPLVRTTFLRLADTLEREPAAAWDAPSLCDGWRVREVVAHMTTAARLTPEEFLAELRADGGDIGTTTDRLAVRDGRLEPATLLADLRSDQLHRWVPPGGGDVGALVHVVVHGLDVTTPLHIAPSADEAAFRIVLDALTSGGIHQHFGVDLQGLHLAATDLDWTWGEGRTISHPAADLVLLSTARRAGGPVTI